MTLLVAMLAVAVGALALLVVGLLRSHAEILRALHQLGVNLDANEQNEHGDHGHDDGARPSVPLPAEAASLERGAHDVSGVTAAGEHAYVGVRDTGTLTLLAFLSTGCLTCAGLWRELAENGQATVVPGGARLVVLAQGEDRESPARVVELAPPGVTTLMSNGAWGDYAVPGAPYFVLVDGTTNRVIGEGTAPTWQRVIELVGEAVGDAATAPAQPNRREFITGRQRIERADRALLEAGIGPGDPSLRPPPAGGPPPP